jgi:hypothetical protein
MYDASKFPFACSFSNRETEQEVHKQAIVEDIAARQRPQFVGNGQLASGGQTIDENQPHYTSFKTLSFCAKPMSNETNPSAEKSPRLPCLPAIRGPQTGAFFYHAGALGRNSSLSTFSLLRFATFRRKLRGRA